MAFGQPTSPVLSLGYSYGLRGWIEGAYIGGTSGGDDYSAGSQAFTGNQNAILTAGFQDKNPDLYFQLCQGILHADIPGAPENPGLPRADYWDRFLMACGVGYPNWVVDADGVADPNQLAPGFWDGPNDRKKGWVYFLPEDTSLTAVVGELFAWFRQYGPIPDDYEVIRDEGPFWGKYSKPTDILKERRVFYYAWKPQTHGFLIRGIEEGNLCCQVMGFSDEKQAWVYPTDWGMDIRVWMKRGPDQWKYFFNLEGWMRSNAASVGQVALTVAATVVNTYTGGASAPFTAALVAGLSKLMKQGQDGATTGQLLYTMFETSRNMVAVADSQGAFKDLKANVESTLGKEAGKIVQWTESVGKPFVNVYNAARKALSENQTYLNAFSGAIKSFGGPNLPKVDANFLETALSNTVLGDGAYWAKKAASFSDPREIDAFINSIPEYAKEAAGYGAMFGLLQNEQVNKSSTSKHFLLIPKVDPVGSFGVLQLKAPLAKILGYPPAKYSSGAPKINGVPLPSSSPQMLSTPAKVAIGVTLGALLLSQLQTYAVGKVLDRVVDKVIP